jgi:hypothetical protein
MHHSASNKTKYSGGNCTQIIITLYYKSQVLDNKQINVQLDKQHETYIGKQRGKNINTFESNLMIDLLLDW